MATLTREQRRVLKARLRKSPSYAGSGVDVSSLTVDNLLHCAQQWNVPVPSHLEAAQEIAGASSAKDAFAGDDEPVKAAPAAAAAPDTDRTSALLAKLGVGDFEGFQQGLMDLARDAAKPPVEKIVEKVVTVEKLVEVEAAPAHLKPSHMPAKTGNGTKVEGIALDVWDAPDAPAIDPLYVWPAGTAVALTKIRREQPIFLSGPAGTGKTSFAEQVAAQQHRPFVRISCHEQTDGPTLVGMTVPDGSGGVRWQDGQLTRAIRRPGTLILIDEPSTARAGAMMILQAVLEPAGKIHIEATGEVVRRAPGVSFIFADNSAGHGDETGQYEAVRRMNRATLDRMAATILIDYLPRQAETKVLMDRTGLAQPEAARLVAFACLTRDAASKGTLTHGVGLRRLISWAEAITDGIPVRLAFDTCVLNGSAPDDREGLRQLATVHLK